MKNTITANQLKTKGVSVLDSATSTDGEAVISVRGKDKYIVLTIEEYNRLREYELDAAIEESKNDIEEGRFIEESVEDHIERITNG